MQRGAPKIMLFQALGCGDSPGHKEGAMGPKIPICALGLGLGLLFFQASPTAARGISVGASFGVGYLPIEEWRIFDGIQDSRYDGDNAGFYGEIYGRKQLADAHALALSIERIGKSASLESTTGSDVEWDFTSVPINVTYEFSLRGAASRNSQFVGLGFGVYHSEVEYVTSGNVGPDTRGTRDGWGYGFHGYVGHRAMVARSMAVSAKVRGRWAEGMALTRDPGDSDVDFHGVDVGVGAEYLF